MEDNNQDPQNTNDIQKKTQKNLGTQDYEMEVTSAASDPKRGEAEPVASETSDPKTRNDQTPQINKYQQTEQKTEPEPQKTIDPNGPPPPEKPVQKNQSPTPGKPEKSKTKAVIALLGIFGAMVLIFLVLAFVFIGQTDQESNPIAQLLGINTAVFVNSLITLVYIIFTLVALTLFILTAVGFVKALMAKKDDKYTKKKNLKLGLISGIMFLVVVIIWFFVFLYMEQKIVRLPDEIQEPIVTEPEETLNLTAPIEIRFDASNIKVDTKKYQVVAYEWDFGDKETGTNQIVTHTYKEKGLYDVVLTVITRDKETTEQLEGQYTTVVSIADLALSSIFSADPQSGEAPLEVVLDASESADPDGTIDRYEWDLDEDGEFDDAEGVEVEHTFEKIGEYEVSLRVTSTTDEYDISTKEIIVEESKEPEAIIKVDNDPVSYETGSQYIFKAGDSTSPNGDIETYEWDFGDGSSTVDTKTAAHTFTTDGTYTVTLTVTDEEDKEGETTLTVAVGQAQGTPVAVIKTEPESTGLSLEGKIPFQVVFDASGTTDSDNNIVDYEWDYDGDGNADGFGKQATHTFDKTGTYSVTLTVTDSDDNKGKETLIVKVKDQGIVADLEANKIEGTAPLSVKFDASGSTYQNGTITSYRWDFGDGTNQKLGDASITHKYSAIGTYTASVTVIGSDNTTDTTELLITVREIALSACFDTPFDSGQAPLETSFDPGCSTGTIANYFWDFGDGNTSTSVKPIHTFEMPGEYPVLLEVTDSENTVSQFEQTIEVTATEN